MHSMTCHSSVNCSEYQRILDEYQECKEQMDQQANYAEPMVWIGIYIAAASAICCLAIIADTIQGFVQKRLWFPCKYFTLNATSLTMLTIAMKLPLDLSTPMPTEIDQIVKLSNMAFMCIIMGNIMPSIGTMNDVEILSNGTALGILVITLVVNVLIELYTGIIYFPVKIEYALVTAFLLILFVLVCFSALTVSTNKKYLEWKYRKMHKMASDEESKKPGNMLVEKLDRDVKKYWMMAETGTPQFVMARSVTCSAAGAICFLTALILVEAEIRIRVWTEGTWYSSGGKSDYKFTTQAILVIDSIAVLVCTTAPALRWLTAVSFTLSKGDNNSLREVFKIEKYWIKKLVEWKESPLALRIHGRKRKKVVQDIKDLTVNFCIGLQLVIVFVSKIVHFIISGFFISPVLLCCHHCNNLRQKLLYKIPIASNIHRGQDADADADLESGEDEVDLRQYALKLEGEQELPKTILKNIFDVVNSLIQMAKKQQPKNLIELLRKSTGFEGVAEFDSDLVEHLHCEEPPNCWSLVVVTLTSIAIALPGVNDDTVDQLLCSISEGLFFIRLIEKSLDSKKGLAHIRKAADVVWLEVELYCRWQNVDLRNISVRGKTSKENLQMLGNRAESTVMKFKKTMHGGLEENPLNWPVKVIAANSMYRVSRTILLESQGRNNYSDEILFKHLSVMIADILGACFTNLPRVITMKCYCSSFERREESVRLAALVLGETEEILKMILQREPPGWEPDQVAYIDDWCNLMKQENPSNFVSPTNGQRASFDSGKLQIATE